MGVVMKEVSRSMHKCKWESSICSAWKCSVDSKVSDLSFLPLRTHKWSKRKVEELCNSKMLLLPSLLINVSSCNSFIQIPKYLTENVSKQNNIVLCGTIGNKSKPNLAINSVQVMSYNLSQAVLWTKYELELIILLSLYYISQMYMQYDFFLI